MDVTKEKCRDENEYLKSSSRVLRSNRVQNGVPKKLEIKIKLHNKAPKNMSSSSEVSKKLIRSDLIMSESLE